MPTITVTRIRIFPFDLTSLGQQTVAFAEVEIDHVLLIRGIRVHRTPAGGLFISFPRAKTRRGEFANLVEIGDAAVARSVRDSVIQAYKESVNPVMASPQGAS